MKKVKQSKLDAAAEVSEILKFLDDYNKARKPAALALVRELRLAVRQVLHGACGELDNGLDDYCVTLAQSDILLAIANMIEKNYRLSLSTAASLAASWDEMV